MGKINHRTIIAFPLFFVLISASALFMSVVGRFGEPVGLLPRVAHAGGGYKGLVYTNSIQALDANEKKFELFEIDFSFTSDDKLVCIHDWDISAELAFGRRFESPPTLRQFNDFVSKNAKYKNCTLDTLVAWLRAHPGKRLVTDVKADNLRALKKIVNTYPEIVGRVIPQIYHPCEYFEVKRMGFVDVILTLYRWDANMPYILFRVLFMDLFAVTIPIERAYFARYFRKLGIPTYVHTINGIEGFDIMRVYGVTEIYTDWLEP